MTNYSSDNRPKDLQSIIDRIFDELQEIPSLQKAAVQAENEYDIAHASAYLQAEGTVEQRKSIVTEQVSDKWIAMENAKNSAKYAEMAAWQVLPKIMMAYQTLSKNQRELDEQLARGNAPRE